MLPTIHNRDEYRRIWSDDARFRPAVEGIVARHGIPGSADRCRGGSQIVFLSPRHVIKLYCPLALEDYEAERVGLALVGAELPVEVPQLTASGELDDWRYTVSTRLHGHELSPRWPTLPDEDRLRLVAQAGELAAALHAVDIPPDVTLPDARRQLAKPASAVLAKHRADGVDATWLDAIAEALVPLPSVDTWPDTSVLLHCDLHPEHLMVEDRDGHPTLCGLFDFGDAMVGPPEYELAATAMLMAGHVPGGTRALLAAYGMRPGDLGPALAGRLTVALLGQRYCALPKVLPWFPPARRPSTLPELLALLWNFGD